jgi:hypothetical protein
MFPGCTFAAQPSAVMQTADFSSKYLSQISSQTILINKNAFLTEVVNKNNLLNIQTTHEYFMFFPIF